MHFLDLGKGGRKLKADQPALFQALRLNGELSQGTGSHAETCACRVPARLPATEPRPEEACASAEVGER